MRRFVFILPILLPFHSLALGQTDNNHPVVNFHTPQEASLMTAIDNPVGLYNGNPEISYNLFTLHDGAVELPLSLQYNASGIKVKQESTWVGLGWDLDVGGMIVQDAVGRLDEQGDYDVKYPYYPQGGFEGYPMCYSRLDDKYKYDVYFDRAKKRYFQPDVFYFRFPEGSGKFYIDYDNGSVHPLSYEKPIKIERDGETSWIITTSDGTRHCFTGGDKATSEGATYQFVSRTWVLSATILPNGQTIRYYYGDETIMSMYRTVSYDYLVEPLVSFPVKSWAKSYQSDCLVSSTEYLLDSITTDNYLVEFRKSPREDYYNGRMLDAIVVTDKLTDRKKQYDFTHTYSSPSVPGNYLRLSQGYFPYNETRNFKRLQLLSVEETGSGSERQRLMKFDYYDYNRLPPKSSFAVDYWGFYNGQTSNNSMFPRLYQLLWNNHDEIIQSSPNDDFSTRACSTEALKYGMLHRITYATGGVTEFEYEPNEFSNVPFIPTCEFLDKEASSVVENSITVRKDLSKTIRINLQAGEEMKLDYKISTGQHYWRELEGTNVYIVSIADGPGVVARYSYTPQDTLQMRYLNKSVTFKAERTTEYVVCVSFPESLVEPSYRGVAEVTVNQKTVRKNGADEKYSQGCGVRVKTVNYYNSSSDVVPVRQTAYEYPRLESGTNGRLLVPLAFHRMHRELTYALKESYGYGVQCSTGGVEETVYSDNVYSAPYSTIGSLVGYSQVNVYDRISGKNSGYTENYFNNRQELSSPDCFQIPQPGNGKPTSIIYKDGSGKVLKSETFQYQSKPVHFYSGVCLYDKFNRTDEFYGSAGRYLVEFGDRTDYGDYVGRYRLMLYGLWSYMYQLRSKSIMQDGVEYKEEYTYDNYGQVKEKTSTDSRGKSLVEKYSYPYEYTDAAYIHMKEQHRFAYPVEQKQYRDGSLIGGRITEYGYYGVAVQYLPSFVRSKNITVPASDCGLISGGNAASLYPILETEYLKYTKTGNPVLVSVKGEDIIYLWGYNGQYPIAEIRGSNYSNVASLLGEDPVKFSERALPDYSRLEEINNKLATSSVTIYRYAPLLGVTSVTKSNGDVTYYEYDSFSRLSRIKDKNGDVLETFTYNYKQTGN